MAQQYVFVPPGLGHELNHLPLPEVLEHLRNHLDNFLLENWTCAAYINRLLGEQEWEGDSQARETLNYLVRKLLQTTPFDVQALGLALRLQDDPCLQARLLALHKTDTEPDQMQRARTSLDQGRTSSARRILEDLLIRSPAHAAAAEQLLALDRRDGSPPGKWLARFACPEPLLPSWRQQIFLHLVAIGALEGTLPLWPHLKAHPLAEAALNAAAELFARTGEQEEAVALYERSLALDPRQTPVRLRIQELRHPSLLNRDLVAQRRVAIYLYTYNKADLLERTLTALRRTDIGPASIKILLNGCTDHSLDVAQAAKTQFPQNDVEIIALPVNIGAPAARNWLIAHEDTWRTDYVAFLDDDLEAPRDWLARFLSVAESDRRIAAVGGKVLFPGDPPRLQYLYRNISVAREDLLRLSLSAPMGQYDTGAYDFVRSTVHVMGCCHLLRTHALHELPSFDIRFSPSQMDDLDHDVLLRLAGYDVRYCGLVSLIHHQNSGMSVRQNDPVKIGNVFGNDIKFFYKHVHRIKEIRSLRSSAVALRAGSA